MTFTVSARETRSESFDTKVYIHIFKNTDIIQKVFSNNTMYVYENRNSDTTVYLINVVQMLKKTNQPYRNNRTLENVTINCHCMCQ